MICATILAGIWMLKPPSEPSEPPDISIQKAALDGNIVAIKQHLAAGTDVNAKDDQYGVTPLHDAAGKGHKEVAELLIAKGADVSAKNNRGFTPLHHAATKKLAELLITEGADVSAKTNRGMTPLYNADNKEIAELLIANGASVNVKIKGGGTPLHYVAYKGHKEVAELLIAKGADVSAKTDGGLTPLDIAIQRDQTETADLLRKHGGKTSEELKAEGK